MASAQTAENWQFQIKINNYFWKFWILWEMLIQTREVICPRYCAHSNFQCLSKPCPLLLVSTCRLPCARHIWVCRHMVSQIREQIQLKKLFLQTELLSDRTVPHLIRHGATQTSVPDWGQEQLLRVKRALCGLEWLHQYLPACVKPQPNMENKTAVIGCFLPYIHQ